MGLQFKPELAQKIMAEGFTSRLEFLKVWAGFYDKAVTLEALEGGRWHLTITTREIVRKIRGGRVRIAGIHFDVVDYPVVIINLLKEHRPYELYTGWALTFHVVEEVQS